MAPPVRFPGSKPGAPPDTQGKAPVFMLFCFVLKKRGYISPSYPMFGDGVNAEEKNWHHIIMPGWMDD
jgi:hypothetical protein